MPRDSVKYGKAPELAIVVRLLTFFAFGTTGCIFLQFLLVTAELYPTAIRSLANSHINVCGRIGNIFGPLAFSMPFKIDGFPYLVMAILCFLDLLAFEFAIPETKGHPLPSQMPLKTKKNSEDARLINDDQR
ncbi:hypothetical protein DICVIV_05077 [Dictyocaulus viviparus]|uniref:Major facilitator superfamily (MFS) profile domain-containing protein n=1 Tax=Dictyocaulus viviparus TaxID=29172 RepID=A0A0D8XYJ6_DICVI|nr:hypothetical protein DICVIV_05077 [Dictyocaulus viviparus]